MYVNSHFVVTTVTLAWIYLCRNEHFYFVRNMFMVAMGIALVCYVRLSPPRRRGCCRSSGFTDSVADFTGVSPTRRCNVLVNPYAAVPSMHVVLRADARRPDGADGPPALGEGRCGALYRCWSRSS